MSINKYIDHTNLMQDATLYDIKKLCDEALKYDFYAVCVNPYYVGYAKKCLEKSEVKIACVVGFPLGANTSEIKSLEAKRAVVDGADEIDMVINVSAVKNKEYSFVLRDIKAVVDAVASVECEGKKAVKVILETCLLTDKEIEKACEIVLESGAQFVKTSTGFSSGGALIEDVKRIRKKVGNRLGIKASGGIRTYEECMAFINVGADRIGASASVQIVSSNDR